MQIESKDYNDSILEFQKYVCEMTQPILEFQKHISEMMQPVIDNLQTTFSKVAEILGESFRPIRVIEKLGNAQYVFWDFMEEDFMETILNSENMDTTLYDFCMKDNFYKVNETINLCREHPRFVTHKNLFQQVIDCYIREQYELAIIGMLSIFDGLLSDVSGDAIKTNIPNRVTSILKRIEDTETIESDDIAVLVLVCTFQKTTDSISLPIKFTENEPDKLNRHFIMHGRSKANFTKLDCIKLINLIYGLILMDDLSVE